MNPDPRRWKALVLLGTAFFMTILDGTSLLTALPAIEDGLDLHGAALQWTVTAYALAFSGLLLLFGRIADFTGRRRVFIVGVVLRIAASLLCGFAWSGEVFIAARALQGISAAIIAPAALSMLTTLFEEGPERNKALGIWGMLGGTGATAGLLLGGVLTDGLGWQWVFFVNVPVGLVVLALAPVLLPAVPGRRTGPFDVLGALTVTAGMVALVYAIIAVSIWPAVAAVLLLAGFVLVERRSAAPLVPFALVRSRPLIGGNLLILAAGMAVDGMLITLTGYVQQERGWSALQFGLLAAVMTVTSTGGLYVQRLATRFGLRAVAAVGGVLLTVSCLVLVQLSVGALVVGLLLFGAGMTTFVCAQISALGGVPSSESGLAAGLVDSSFSIGTALGVAACSAAALAASSPTAGHRAGFAVAAVFGGFALVVALTLLAGRTREPAPA